MPISQRKPLILPDLPGTFRLPDAANDNAPQRIIRPIFPSDWADWDVPEREWFVPNLIPARNVTLLSGDGGLGKSLLALQLAVAAALGTTTAGLTPTPGRVIYVGAEDDHEEMHRRLADVCASMGASLEDIGTRFSLICLADEDALIAESDQRGTLRPTKLYGALNHHIGEHDPVLVVLDTLADLFGGDEIKRAHVRQFISMLRRLALDHDCAVLLLAHPSLDGIRSGTGTSGSTAWNNSVRSRLYLTAPSDDDPDARQLSQKKSNYGPRDTALKLRWRDGVFIEDDGKPSAAEGLLSSRVDRVFVAALSKLTRQGQRLSPSKSPTYAPKVISRQEEAKGITVKQLEEAQQRLLDNGEISILEEGPPSRRYRRLVVSSEDFSGKEVV